MRDEYYPLCKTKEYKTGGWRYLKFSRALSNMKRPKRENMVNIENAEIPQSSKDGIVEAKKEKETSHLITWRQRVKMKMTDDLNKSFLSKERPKFS